MPKSIASRLYFLSFGVLNLAALLTAFIYSLDALIEYFSYFTVLSNIMITYVFLMFGLMGTKNGHKVKLVKVLYGPAVLYMSITGVVFWTLLHGGAGHLQILPWVNLTLHGITPLAAFAGWILFPYKEKLTYSDAFKWLLFPLLFVVYTLIRGPFAHWYPYVILNPETAGGYLGVLRYILLILCGSYLAGLLLIFLHNMLIRRK